MTAIPTGNAMTRTRASATGTASRRRHPWPARTAAHDPPTSRTSEAASRTVAAAARSVASPVARKRGPSMAPAAVPAVPRTSARAVRARGRPARMARYAARPSAANSTARPARPAGEPSAATATVSAAPPTRVARGRGSGRPADVPGRRRAVREEERPAGAEVEVIAGRSSRARHGDHDDGARGMAGDLAADRAEGRRVEPPKAPTTQDDEVAGLGLAKDPLGR